MFNQISYRYDLLNDLLSFCIHRTWLKKAVNSIPIQDKLKILDLATGTGNFVFEFLKANQNLDITGIDIAENMLEIARKKNFKYGNKAKFLFGDATAIPFADNYFDLVTISYGIRNVANVEKCLKEIQQGFETKWIFSHSGIWSSSILVFTNFSSIPKSVHSFFRWINLARISMHTTILSERSTNFQVVKILWNSLIEPICFTMLHLSHLLLVLLIYTLVKPESKTNLFLLSV